MIVFPTLGYPPGPLHKSPVNPTNRSLGRKLMCNPTFSISTLEGSRWRCHLRELIEHAMSIVQLSYNFAF